MSENDQGQPGPEDAPAPGEGRAGRPPASARPSAPLSDWAPSKTQLLVLVIGLLAASNLAQWIALRQNPDTRPVTVVAVRQMTQDYVRRITSPQLSEAESVLRAKLFIAAAQDELRRLIPSDRLVLARECVLSGTMNDITPQLQKRVEDKLAEAGSGLSGSFGPAPTATLGGEAILNGRVSAANLLTPSAAASRGGGQ